MKQDVIRLIEASLNNDKHKLINYSKRIGNYLIENNDKNTGNKILSLIAEKNLNYSTLDSLATKPVDKEGNLDMVDVSLPVETSESLFFNESIEKQVMEFIETYNKREQLISAGLEPKHNLLLFGVPGTGKTSLARYISLLTDLPLVTVQFDSLISSLLGNTAKNINKVFDYASNQPCILFLDEFDVIAKMRDDKNELGELKRVVNSLLQNIDNFDNDKILIAATNHEKLLDTAIWRRFDTVLKLDLPEADLREKIIIEYSKLFRNNYIDDTKRREMLINLTADLSPADIKSIIYSAAKKSILNNKEVINYGNVVYELYLFYNHGGGKKEDAIEFMLQHSTTQKDIKEILNVTDRLVRKISKEVK